MLCRYIIRCAICRLTRRNVDTIACGWCYLFMSSFANYFRHFVRSIIVGWIVLGSKYYYFPWWPFDSSNRCLFCTRWSISIPIAGVDGEPVARVSDIVVGGSTQSFPDAEGITAIVIPSFGCGHRVGNLIRTVGMHIHVGRFHHPLVTVIPFPCHRRPDLLSDRARVVLTIRIVNFNHKDMDPDGVKINGRQD